MPGQYWPIPQHQLDSDEKHIDQDVSRRIPFSQGKPYSTILLLALVASLGANLFLVCKVHISLLRSAEDLTSKFAGLSRNVTTQRQDNFAEFDSLNRTVQNHAWNNRDLEPWNGFLALDEDAAISQGLQHAQRWPWDESKGVYILVSAHELHCVRALRISINEDQDGVPHDQRTWAYPHVIHCLNVLRESVMCNADDTPMYVGRLNENEFVEHPRAGTGSMKMCRDWQALLSWSHAHSACYRPIALRHGETEVDRYKYCPDGSRPWESLEQS